MDIDDTRRVAANRLDAASTAIREEASYLPNDRLSHLAHTTAERIGRAADYVRTHDAQRIIEDVETAVKNNPGPSLLIAAALGFLAARAMTRD
jgi:ElaB/YqjD/DUF883 family membrane-anchored ribosome-binding protein